VAGFEVIGDSSDQGGVTAAVLFTFTSTCQRHGIDPFAYLRDVLDRLAGGNLSAEELDRWTAGQIPPAIQAMS
jgi:hypothetical protein